MWRSSRPTLTSHHLSDSSLPPVLTHPTNLPYCMVEHLWRFHSSGTIGSKRRNESAESNEVVLDDNGEAGQPHVLPAISTGHLACCAPRYFWLSG